MFRVLLLLAIIFAVVYLFYGFRGLTAEKKQRILKWVLFGGLFILLSVLVLSGRLNWLVAAIGAIVPLLPRAAKLLFGLWPAIRPYFSRYQQNKQSSMQTGFIRLEIDILTGKLKGVVLKGQFKEQRLENMSVEQLKLLLEECRKEDVESAALLASYLKQTHTDWSTGDSTHYDYAPDSSSMSLEQAREILGLSEKPSKEEIIRSHKRLMQKLHPDRGGTDYLATQINLAKDILLKSL